MTALARLPEDPSLLTRVRTGFQCLMVLKDDPGDPEAGALVNDCFELEVYARLVEELRQTPEGRRLLTERPSLMAQDVDLEALDALPEHTLGHHFARYFLDQGITPFQTEQPLRNEVDYLSKRYRETHDLYHVVTGYDIDLVGEMELQAFVRGNLGIRAPLLILPFGYVASWFGEGGVEATTVGPRLAPWTYAHRLRVARDRGASVAPLISFFFEDHWETPLSDVQAMLVGQRRQAA